MFSLSTDDLTSIKVLPAGPTSTHIHVHGKIDICTINNLRNRINVLASTPYTFIISDITHYHKIRSYKGVSLSAIRNTL